MPAARDPFTGRFVKGGLGGLDEFSKGIYQDIDSALDLVLATLIDDVAFVHNIVVAEWPVLTGYSLSSFDVSVNDPQFSTPEEERGSKVHKVLTEQQLRAKLKAAGRQLKRAYYTNGAHYSGFVEDGTEKMPARKVLAAAVAALGARRAAS